MLEFQHRVNTNAGCANTIAASGLSMAGTNFIQIGGAVTSSEFSGDTFCGSVLSSFVLDRALGPDAAGATVPTAVIGEKHEMIINYQPRIFIYHWLVLQKIKFFMESYEI